MLYFAFVPLHLSKLVIYKTISVCLLLLLPLFSFVSFRRTKASFLDVYISTKIRFIINVISLETFVKLISLSHFLSRVPSLRLHSSSSTDPVSLLGIPNPYVGYSIRHKHLYLLQLPLIDRSHLITNP